MVLIKKIGIRRNVDSNIIYLAIKSKDESLNYKKLLIEEGAREYDEEFHDENNKQNDDFGCGYSGDNIV